MLRLFSCFHGCYGRERGSVSERIPLVIEIILYLMPLMVLIWMICCCTAPVPKTDDYDAILAYLNRPLPERLTHLTDFHNEHRIFTARLVFEAIVQTLGYFDFRVCMAIGALFLYGYGLLFRRLFLLNERCSKWFYFTFLWLVVSFLNYDNVCWAMTSASNVQVHFWALLALVFAVKREKGVCFALSLLCATLATFSTGAGMPVWGALAVVVIHDYIRRCKDWSSVFRNKSFVFKFNKAQIFRLVTGVGLCACVVAYYFRGFQRAINGAEFSISNAVITFVAFLGAIIPIGYVALLLGACVLFCIALIIWRLPRIQNTLAIAFLAYLLANVLSAALFRSNDPMSILACRMRLIPISLLGVVVALLLEVLSLPPKLMRRLAVVFFLGAISYLLLFTWTSYPSLQKQNQQLLDGILAWPNETSGLWYDNRDMKRIDGILRKAVESGVYNLPRAER